jgi:hypothetical protein
MMLGFYNYNLCREYLTFDPTFLLFLLVECDVVLYIIPQLRYITGKLRHRDFQSIYAHVLLYPHGQLGHACQCLKASSSRFETQVMQQHIISCTRVGSCNMRGCCRRASANHLHANQPGELDHNDFQISNTETNLYLIQQLPKIRQI